MCACFAGEQACIIIIRSVIILLLIPSHIHPLLLASLIPRPPPLPLPPSPSLHPFSSASAVALSLSRALLSCSSLPPPLFLCHTHAHAHAHTHATGLFTDLYYIRDGRKNDYALQFQVPVSPNISVLFFHWQNLGKQPIAYSVGLQVSEKQVLDETDMNIRAEGEVPTTEQVIQIAIPCLPCVTSEVDVSILFNFSFPIKGGTNLTSLSLKRKKVCVAKIANTVLCNELAASVLSPQSSQSSRKRLTSSLSLHPSSHSQPSSSRPDSQSAALVVTVGYAAAFTCLLVFFLLMCTRRSGEERDCVLARRDPSVGCSRASSDFSLKKITSAESCRSVSRCHPEIDGIWFL